MTGLPKCSWTNACDSRSYLCPSEIKLAHTDDDFLWRRDAASGQHEEALTLVVNARDLQKRGGKFLFVPALMRVKGLILASRSAEDYPEAEGSLLSAIDWGETPVRHPV